MYTTATTQNKFAHNLKSLRKDKGLSQNKIADVFEVTGSTVSGWESGDSFPNLKLFSAICQYFGTDPTSMLWGDVDVLGVEPAEPKVSDVILGYKVQVQKNSGGKNEQQQADANCSNCEEKCRQLEEELTAAYKKLSQLQDKYIILLEGG